MKTNMNPVFYEEEKLGSKDSFRRHLRQSTQSGDTLSQAITQKEQEMLLITYWTS